MALLVFAASVTAGAAAQNPSAVGDWLTEKKNGIIEIYRCAGGDALCGKLAWFRIKPDDPNPLALDLNNPDPQLRSRSLCAMTFMTGFKQTDANKWEDGSIYDPDSGNNYHATMKLRDDGTLDLHGYIGISLIGRSEIWTRYKDPVPPCPGH